MWRTKTVTDFTKQLKRTLQPGRNRCETNRFWTGKRRMRNTRDVLNGRRRWGPTRSNSRIAARPRFHTKRLPTRRRPHIAASVGRGRSGWKRLRALASSRRFPSLHSGYREASRRSDGGRTAVARRETLSSDRTPGFFLPTWTG
jgi:hypothetical protein